MRYARSRPLFGEDFVKLQQAKVLLLGVGGVGGICLECLIRSGVSDIRLWILIVLKRVTKIAN